MKKIILTLPAVLFGLLLATNAYTTILPEDRSDVMYHSYDGGGMTIDGTSILVRKKATNNISIVANQYIDKISAASIDVLATASAYTEERKEYTIGVDYLNEKTVFSISQTLSDENDFEANTFNIGLTQDFYGDMTTLSMSYSKGNDKIFTVGNSTPEGKASRQNYRLGVSQIVSKNMIAQFNLEFISDEGFLRNPYRVIRFTDTSNEKGFDTHNEIYPNTRTSRAFAMRVKYFLSNKSALSSEYRYFNDTWGIDAHTLSLGYAYPFKQHWIFDIRLRHYTQNKADFYSDLFSRAREFTFMARDKEMSTFTDNSIGLAISYTTPLEKIDWLEKSRVSLKWEYIQFEYDDFRNVLKSTSNTVGTEPLYSFSANVIQIFASVWY